uniref:Uncharacterized protein n=1 Tax=Trichogramma kaykai TaxID=54128 RepID=A0ABD2WKH9_9HYME
MVSVAKRITVAGMPSEPQLDDLQLCMATWTSRDVTGLKENAGSGLSKGLEQITSTESRVSGGDADDTEA